MQVGDPFMGKLLLEACLELFQSDTLEGIQDMGAAGLTSSSVEMAGRAENGIELDLDCVPRRAKKMSAYEILLSESQERMLLVAKRGRENEVIAICKKWELDAAVIGRVTDTKRWVIKATPGYDPLDAPPSAAIKREPMVVCDIPIGVLTDDAPIYDRPRKADAGLAARTAVEAAAIPLPTDWAGELRAMCGSPNLGSRRWIWRQYDHIVRGGTVVRPGSDAAVVRVLCERDGQTFEKFLAFSVDCNGRYVELDAFQGGAMAVAEACRNVVCSGAEPIGLTDCLNFGNPERPEVMDTFARAIDGIAAACLALGVPIVSGNVSLYNETNGRAILPTPTIGAVGLFRSGEDRLTQWFKRAGHAVVLLGTNAPSLGGSEYLAQKLGRGAVGEALAIDLAAEARLQQLVLDLAQTKKLQSAHDVSEGGLAVALAECCTTAPTPSEDVGARIDLDLPASGLEKAALLFGENPTRILVSVAPEHLSNVLDRARAQGVPAAELGMTGGSSLSIAFAAKVRGAAEGVENAATELVYAEIADLRAARDRALDSIVG